MRLCIRQKVFSWTSQFTVTDDSGRDRYKVQGEFLSWGKRLHVYDMTGIEAVYIEQKI